ncbi:MAG TPA: SirB2 family protein [Burkholderiales bacterium]|nr:SirB2 family protein [Burkholderiales bacterium]
MSVFLWIKATHVASVGLSIAGFVARGGLMLRRSPLLEARFVRVAPHVVDSVLLASALWLCWLLREYPLADGWLTAKLIGLAAYVALGTIALKRGRTPRVRAAAFAAALVAFAYIVWVAVTRDARGPLALLGSA